MFYYITNAAIAIALVAKLHFISAFLTSPPLPSSEAAPSPVRSRTIDPPTFTRVVIDPTPPVTTLEKALADLDGDGRQDAIIGFGNPPGSLTGHGIAWYEYPHSGVVTDAWKKHSIITSGVAYEDLVPFDVNHDGAMDVVASVDNNIYWFENPKGHGGNPATDPW